MPQGGRALHLRVGLLVLAGLGLAVGFILYLSAGRFTARQMIFETYITESVAGLDIGAPVRFRGVRIGRVSEIALATAVYGRSTGGSTDAANRLVLIRFAVDPDRYGEGAEVAGAVAAGLRVRIASQGVTGISYLEVDFVGDPARAPPIEVPWTPRYPVIPSVPSTITQVTSAAERVMTRLADIDVQALILSATALLDELRALAQGDGDLALTLREAAQAMRALHEGCGMRISPTPSRSCAKPPRSWVPRGSPPKRCWHRRRSRPPPAISARRPPSCAPPSPGCPP
jgi:paraquat-inducible protein B